MSLKTFDLVHVTDNTNPGVNKSQGNITCIEAANDNLYIGSSDCFLTHYSIEKVFSPTGKVTYMKKLQRHKHLGLRKPVKQLMACTAIQQLLVLCETNVYSVSMIGLEFKSSSNREVFRGVSVMAYNNKPTIFNPDEDLICLGTRKKTIQVISITKLNFIIVKEISVSDIPYVLSINAQTICTIIGRKYCLVNFVTSAIQELFEYESQNVSPLVKCIGREQFLLNGPTSTMGMIVTSEGVSMHQPMTWSDGISFVACSYPYILVLGKSTVTIHSLIDQRQKQAIQFSNGVYINDFNGDVFIATNKSVLSFVLVPFHKQMQLLMTEKRIEEVFQLLLVASKIDPKQYSLEFERKVQTQVAFIYFKEKDFDKALYWFVESCMDPCELIVLYPLMMPSNTNFTPSRPLFHSIQDLSLIIDGNKAIFHKFKMFLLKYLEIVRKQHNNSEIDTALVKLYIEFDHSNLPVFLSTENCCFKDDTFSWLEQFKRFHCMALYYCYLKVPAKAMQIWCKLATKELQDAKYPGIFCVVDYMCTVTDLELIWSNAPWLLHKDEIIAVKIFTSLNLFDFERVCEFLQKFPIALQIYLEHLVLEKKIERETFHTHLAVIYVDKVLELLKDKIQIKEEIAAARERLQALLEQSSLYRVATILQKLSNLPLYKETAILYSKLEQHDCALKILVYKLNDYNAAEIYCDDISKNKDDLFRQKIFYTLLIVYLTPDYEIDGVRPEHFIIPAVKLLNQRQSQFNAIHVLTVLPENWPVDLIQPFLLGSLRKSLFNQKQAKIESSLLRQYFINTKALHMSLQTGYLKLTEDSVCDFCHRPYTETVSVRYPNNKCVHPHCCKNKHICPVTNQTFK